MLTYKDAGVDIDAGNALVKRIQQLCPNIGGFSGMYPLGDSYLVACTDGVGTKLKIAFALNRHDSIGTDLVAMSVNDLITSGAKPLFFLDYFATSKLDVDQAEEVITGIVKGCEDAGCALLGGETAEMPGFYQPGDYDLSGFAVGIVHKDKVIDGKSIQGGDVVLGLPSTGVHSNGYSLARQVDIPYDQYIPELNCSWGEALLTPTKIYVREILDIIQAHPVKGIAHITGGGLYENTRRVLPEGLKLTIQWKLWDTPPIFRLIQDARQVSCDEMRRTFNMGIGMVVICDPDTATQLMKERDLIHVGDIDNG